ncbi:MAG TPA: LOG family protein [bacterium]|nr:LOG family protein [bacterium]
MKVIATAVRTAGGSVTGIIPRVFQSLADPDVHQILTDTLQDRKRLMLENADAFVAFPGGFGTLDEITEVIVDAVIRSSPKPLVFLNLDGFYDALFQHFDAMFSRKLADHRYRSMLICADCPEDVFTALDTFTVGPGLL